MTLRKFSIFTRGARAFGRLGVGGNRGVTLIFWAGPRETLLAEVGAAGGRELRRLWRNLIPPDGVEGGSIPELHLIFSGGLGISPLTRAAAVIIVDIAQDRPATVLHILIRVGWKIEVRLIMIHAARDRYVI